MYKLWRRQISKNNTVHVNDKKKESQFSQLLSHVIKMIRKKEEFYIRIISVPLPQFYAVYSCNSTNIQNVKNKINFNANGNQQTMYNGTISHDNISLNESTKNIESLKVHELQMECESLIQEEQEILEKLKLFQEQQFCVSKTYVYTMFVRILEIYDYYYQKIILKIKNQYEIYTDNWQKYYQDNRLSLTEFYQNLVYQQNYNVIQLICFATQKQNAKIYSIIPPKSKKNQVSLKPLIRVNSLELRKNNPVDLKYQRMINDGEQHSVKKMNLKQTNDVISRKLLFKQRKLLTEKRIQDREVTKKRQLIFKSFYGVLMVKMPKFEEGNAFKKGLENDAMQRNEAIIESRRKEHKRYQIRMNSIKMQQKQKI